MLYENDIVDSVSLYLKSQGFEIEQACKSTERGDDIIAVHISGLRLYIEAKGETSAREGSARYGLPFHSGQVLDVVAKAFYKACLMLDENPNQLRCAGLALPDTLPFRQRIGAIEKSLSRLGLIVFWVQPDHSVKPSIDLPTSCTQTTEETVIDKGIHRIEEIVSGKVQGLPLEEFLRKFEN